MKFMRNKLLLAVMLILLTIALVGCGGGQSRQEQPTGQKEEAKNETTTKKIWLSIATGGTGGVYYPYGGGVASIINDHIPNVEATAEVTGASVENTKMVASGQAMLATIMNDVGYQAYHGTGRFEGNKKDIRTVFLMYPNIYQVVTLKETGIKTLEDLKGKRVSVGAPGSGTEYKTNLIFDLLGISYDDFIVQRLPFADQANNLRDKTLDVGIWSVAAPTSSITELAATQDIYIIPFSQEDLDKITSAYPFYNAGEVPAGTYKGQDEAVPTPTVWNTMITSKDAPEDLIYKIVKAVFENRETLINIHKAANWTTPENTIANAVVPLHPGALKYYKELGLEIPDRLIPPEAK
ncbi:TAXI family TRAP transporter solute-binding subunit [Calderihabitans maritimus]|uniref:TAXI family TRAP transporter solute receptor n=1 Tax=Calderihabitans maritimus TaxID=1246530 RepID=A0A1Z5HQE4_9FIRM|nr:TAXI family TRAP transporter solute-binding subunit [Calderihabitans maritimus]GAW91587.1 TAXI family TRAP transporter solute receptor [Calderihabitans maritimus]